LIVGSDKAIPARREQSDEGGKAQRPKGFVARVLRYLLYAVIIALAASMLYPLYWMTVTSFKQKTDVFSGEPKMIPGRTLAQKVVDDPRWFFKTKWENYPNLFTWKERTGQDTSIGTGWSKYLLQGFGRFVLNSTFIALVVTLGQVITCSLAAFAFARLQFPGRDKIFLGYLATLMIPATVTMIPAYMLLRELNWLDTYGAIILPSVFSAYGTFMLRQFFKTIPQEIEDAARIDGCGAFGLYWRIMLPLSTPALATLTIITFVGSWRSFMWPLIVSSSEDVFNLPLGLTLYRGLFGDPDWPLLMAGSMILTLPMMIVFMFGQRYFVEGIRLGAVKG
jgi:multiple sugar transport system permease protein